MPTEKYVRSLMDESNITGTETKKEVARGCGRSFCSNLPELVPNFDIAPCEVSLGPGRFNSSIVLGRDRNASWASGAGGDGMVQCGMIDLVAGRGQLIMAENDDLGGPLKSIDQEIGIGPSFVSDAARIYITQKSKNIDQYFGLKEGEGRTSKFKSAVGIKADHVRVIGREKVKIFCGAGNWEGFSIGETNCLGQPLARGRIELQVGNDSKLQPVVLGNNLVQHLKNNKIEREKIQKAIQDININLSILNQIIGGSIPGAALVTAPMSKQSVTHTLQSISHVINGYVEQLESLDSTPIPGANHILSKTVFTT